MKLRSLVSIIRRIILVINIYSKCCRFRGHRILLIRVSFPRNVHAVADVDANVIAKMTQNDVCFDVDESIVHRKYSWTLI